MAKHTIVMGLNYHQNVIKLGLNGFMVDIYEDWGCIKHIHFLIFSNECREVLIQALIQVPHCPIFFIVIVVKSTEIQGQINTEDLWKNIKNKSNYVLIFHVSGSGPLSASEE